MAKNEIGEQFRPALNFIRSVHAGDQFSVNEVANVFQKPEAEARKLARAAVSYMVRMSKDPYVVTPWRPYMNLTGSQMFTRTVHSPSTDRPFLKGCDVEMLRGKPEKPKRGGRRSKMVPPGVTVTEQDLGPVSPDNPLAKMVGQALHAPIVLMDAKSEAPAVGNKGETYEEDIPLTDDRRHTLVAVHRGRAWVTNIINDFNHAVNFTRDMSRFHSAVDAETKWPAFGDLETLLKGSGARFRVNVKTDGVNLVEGDLIEIPTTLSIVVKMKASNNNPSQNNFDRIQRDVEDPFNPSPVTPVLPKNDDVAF